MNLRRCAELSARSSEFDHGVAFDVRDVAEIAYRGHLPVEQHELDEIAGLSVVGITEHGNVSRESGHAGTRWQSLTAA